MVFLHHFFQHTYSDNVCSIPGFALQVDPKSNFGCGVFLVLKPLTTGLSMFCSQSTGKKDPGRLGGNLFLVVAYFNMVYDRALKIPATYLGPISRSILRLYISAFCVPSPVCVYIADILENGLYPASFCVYLCPDPVQDPVAVKVKTG